MEFYSIFCLSDDREVILSKRARKSFSNASTEIAGKKFEVCYYYLNYNLLGIPHIHMYTLRYAFSIKSKKSPSS